MESHDCVYLNGALDAHLARRRKPRPPLKHTYTRTHLLERLVVTLLFSGWLGSPSRHPGRLPADGQQPLHLLAVGRRVARLPPPPQGRLRGRADGGVQLRQVANAAFDLFSWV